jgi:hypothetical protein
MSDPVSDLLARIRNAGQAKHAELVCPSSKLKLAVTKVLVENGYIDSVTVEAVAGGTQCSDPYSRQALSSAAVFNGLYSSAGPQILKLLCLVSGSFSLRRSPRNSFNGVNSILQGSWLKG